MIGVKEIGATAGKSLSWKVDLTEKTNASSPEPFYVPCFQLANLNTRFVANFAGKRKGNEMGNKLM